MVSDASDARFYLLSCLGFTTAAVIASISMTAVGVNQGQTLSIVVTIMGFATLAITQYRATVQAALIGKDAADAAKEASKAVTSVKQALTMSDSASVESLRKITDSITDRISEVMTISKATHVLVNSQRAALLEAHAILWQRLADFTGTVEDRRSASLAREAAEEHKSK